MLSYADAVEARFLVNLEEQISSLADKVLSGNLTPEDYRYHTGMIAGLRRAAALLGETHEQLTKA